MGKTLQLKGINDRRLQVRSWGNKETKAGFSSKNTESSSTLSKVRASRSGVSANNFNALIDRLPFTLSDWSGYLHISERSIQRYIQENKTFELPLSERILEIKNLFSVGKEVFGDPEKFKKWLYRPRIPLGGECPVDLLDTSEGIQLLLTELHHIEHGIFA